MFVNKWDGDILKEWEEFQIYEAETRKQWEAFMKTGKMEKEGHIQAEVFSSWLRCRERRLDPFDCKLTILPEKDLAVRLQKNKLLLKIAAPILRDMADGIKDAGIRFDLYDADLYLLDRFKVIDREATKPKRSMPLGTSQREADCGTNAVHLASVLERPVQLMGYEHFNVSFHMLTCAAVPIRDTNGKVIAIINVDCYSWPIHKHTLGMLIAMRRNIEIDLRRVSECREEFDRRLGKIMTEFVEAPCISVDENGIIHTVNGEALRILKFNGLDIIGRSAESLWGTQNPFTEVLQRRQNILNREVIFTSNNKAIRLTGNIRQVLGKDKTLLGACGIFYDLCDKRKQKCDFAAYFTFENIISQSAIMGQTIQLAKEIATMQSNTLIQGESGTGKELFAQSIHNASLYKDGPFVAVNCSAIPSGLLESELFGYEGGAFTGAKKEGRLGKFELARGGTIFLDEINSMPLDMQVKILRTIQCKTITPVGGTTEIPIHVRILCATNTDLWKMVKDGGFREDLFYRINVITIYIPPLRERSEDIPLLIRHTLSKLENQTQIALTIDKDAYLLMEQYCWPGNVRELENVIERSMVLARTRGSNQITTEELLKYQGIHEFVLSQNENKDASATGLLAIDTRSLEFMEKAEIEKALSKHSGNILKTAKELGIARNTLYRKMERYRIQNDFKK